MRSSQQEHLVHQGIKYCWTVPTLLVETLVHSYCIVSCGPWLCSLRKHLLAQSFLWAQQTFEIIQLSQLLPSGAGLKPRVCRRHQTTPVVFQARLVGFWQCKSLETDLALDIFSFSQFSRQVNMETLV